MKKLQPDAKIYIQSILPVNSKAIKTNKVFTNDNVDVGSVMKASNGALPEDASTDGIHLVHSYCQKWLDYLIKNS